MDPIRYFHVDAFTDRLFAGNPAGVCLLDRPLEPALMQAIAAENNLAETAFVSPAADDGADFELRWFTPTVEIPLCGHATLASGFVVLTEGALAGEMVRFRSRHSGLLTVSREGERYTLDFPAIASHEVAVPKGLPGALGADVAEARLADNHMLIAVLASARAVRDLAPDIRALVAFSDHSVAVTAPADRPEYDIVSRMFGPAVGIDEDPVTGALHCVLVPLWAERLGRDTIAAYQASARGGRLDCRLAGGRVTLTGGARLYARSQLFVDR
ncbi:MAG: PhzF family phenazine biosynthesis protein [Azospirillaceae bacterium]